MQLSERVPEGECWIPSQPPINRGIRCNAGCCKEGSRVAQSRNPLSIGEFDGGGHSFSCEARARYDPHSQSPINRGIRWWGSLFATKYGQAMTPTRNPLSIGEFDATGRKLDVETVARVSQSPINRGIRCNVINLARFIRRLRESQPPINRGIRCNVLAIIEDPSSIDVATPYQSGNSMQHVKRICRKALEEVAIPYQSGNPMQHKGHRPRRAIRRRRNPLSIGEFDATRSGMGGVS